MRRLTIGEFSELTHLSVRMLRRYHQSGLLEPASIDPTTGYRYYSPEQIPAAQVVHRLRELDVPLTEVRKILATEDADERAQLVEDHARRLEETVLRTRAAIASLRRLAGPSHHGPLAVELRSLPAQTVAAVRGVVAQGDVLDWYAGAMEEIDSALAGAAILGPAGGHYANALFTGGEGEALVYRPAADPPQVGRVEPVTLAAAEVATTVHYGPHDDIDVTYSLLGAWVVDQALAVDGPVHERYLVTPADTADSARWRTEIGWPVFRLDQRAAITSTG